MKRKLVGGEVAFKGGCLPCTDHPWRLLRVVEGALEAAGPCPGCETPSESVPRAAAMCMHCCLLRCLLVSNAVGRRLLVQWAQTRLIDE